MLTTLPASSADRSLALRLLVAATPRLWAGDYLRAAIVSSIFELVWTIYHGSGFAPGMLLREWCIGFLVGLCITLGERVLLEAIGREQPRANSQAPGRHS